ncbi:MAG TPA: efflux RND transporter permease subunit [Bacteroidales bacterium]|nr:efflux RND transporter permease subunit [Bacteroidales bacterium]
MATKELSDRVVREFKLTTLALKNRNTIFLLTIIVVVFGLISYVRLPKELFPDIVIPTVLVQTTYPGNSPIDIENLVTRPLEKEIDGINGIKSLKSTSAQDASMIFVEFNTDVAIEDALDDVKDAVDKAKSDLPNDPGLIDPVVMDIDLSEFPIININLSGDFSIEELKEQAEYLQDQLESIYEISKVQIEGVDEREVKVNVDLNRMESNELTFMEIENAISNENITMSGGEILLGDTRRSIRIKGEFTSVDELRNIIVKEEDNKVIYLKDVADVIYGYAEPKSFARLNHQPVVSVQVIKKSGENLLTATNKIFKVLDDARATNAIPADLNVTLTNDQSDMVRKQLHSLENNMIMGVILVVLVLFYFLGTRNALFVGLAIPMSMFLSFVILNVLGLKLNMIVLFSLILALGMLVDNAIVVVENIYRFVDMGYPPFRAAKQAVGEIAVAIITSTLTTLSAFLPLAFWGGITGEFMKNLPITLIIVLSSSLFVALVIVPVFSATFIKAGGDRDTNKPDRRKSIRIALLLVGLSVPMFLAGWRILPNLMVFFAFLGLMNLLFFHKAENWFQNVFLVKLENVYTRVLTFALGGKNPLWFFLGTFGLLIFTIVFYASRDIKVNFFPVNEPSYINIQAELPLGTDIRKTNQFMMRMEDDIDKIIEPYRPAVKSVLTTVGKGISTDEAVGGTPYKALTTVSFVDYNDRHGINTAQVMRDLSDHLINRYPGVKISLEKNQMGPPAGKPINIEVSGENFDKLLSLSDSISAIIENSNIEGIEGLQMDLKVDKPELLISLDRDKLRRFGLSTAMVAMDIRTALFGKEVSDYKVGEDEYPIQLRLMDKYRYNLPALLNQKLIFREDGQTYQLPISAIATVRYQTTYNSIRRKDMNRVITISSNVISGYNANNINDQIRTVLDGAIDMPEGYTYSFTGEQQEQQESMAFLMRAMIIALALILLILVTQFNSLVKPLIILISVLFSTIGVFGGLATFKMDFIVVMTGIGIVSLAGIVVNNAIVLVDYIELLKSRKRKELGLDPDAFLPLKEANDCVVMGGRTRLRPVLLTAITTVLGLISLAIGLNIDFEGLLSSYKPDLYFGGDHVLFWGPISWTIIFGLTFSTFLTLVIVPVMYRLTTIITKRLMDLSERMFPGRRKKKFGGVSPASQLED